MNDEAVSSSMDQVKQSYETICNNIARVIIGKLYMIDLLVVGLLSDGHILIKKKSLPGRTTIQ